LKDFRVLFIYPNTMMATLVPASISILYPCLKAFGIKVELFDTTFYKTAEKSFEQRRVDLLQIKEFNLGVPLIKSDIYKDLNKKVVSFNPDLIAITIVEDTFPLAKSLLESIKHFNVPTIAGGVFTSLAPEEVMPYVDIVCIGEGELALTELCDKMSNGRDYTDIQNLWVKGHEKKPLRPPINLDHLPFLDYDIFRRDRLCRPMMGKTYTMIHIELGRGCPYACTYCEAPQIKGLYAEGGHTYHRRKSPLRVLEELKHLVAKYKPDYINFNAESFLARPLEELQELAIGYRGIGLPFWCQSRPETVTEEKIVLLKNMGCKNFQFGIECGNEQFRRKVLNRFCDNEQILETARILEKNSIQYTVNNIIGFPDETRDLIFETIELNQQIHPTTINCFMFTPYKGTVLYKYCREKGYLGNNAVHQLVDGTELNMPSITYQELKGLQRTFPLYARMPKEEWARIGFAERFNEFGNRIFQELREVYYKRYFS